MSTWFTISVKYTKRMADGKLKHVTEPYLIETESFRSAEERIIQEVGQYAVGDFGIKSISKTNYTDVFPYDDSDLWYKCKFTYLSVDVEGENNKKISGYVLVTAGNLKEAFDRVKERLGEMIDSFDIPTISQTNIVDVFLYNPKFESTIPKIGNIISDNLEDFAPEAEETQDAEPKNWVTFEDDNE